MRNSFLPRLMYDNVVTNPGSGGSSIGTDNIGGIEYQRIKIIHGADGTNAGDVNVNNGFPIQGSQSATSSTSWTSATALNTANTLSIIGLNTVSIAVIAGTTITAGAIIFEVSPDGTNWIPINAARIDSYTVESAYTLVASVNRAWSTSVDGFISFRVRLSTAIVGTGTVSIFVIGQAFAIEPIVSVGPGSVLTKGTQGANGFSVQDLKDSGRNAVHLYTNVPILTTATDALLSLTGYKSGAAVAATTTPAVVTTGKTFRINTIALTYVAVATAGAVKFTLRANLSGVVAIGSPAVNVWVIGGPEAIAGTTNSLEVTFPEGLEFPAGAGIGISQVGLNNTQAAAITGYGFISIYGYEY